MWKGLLYVIIGRVSTAAWLGQGEPSRVPSHVDGIHRLPVPWPGQEANSNAKMRGNWPNIASRECCRIWNSRRLRKRRGYSARLYNRCGFSTKTMVFRNSLRSAAIKSAIQPEHRTTGAIGAILYIYGSTHHGGYSVNRNARFGLHNMAGA